MAEIHNEQHLQEPEALPWQELVAPIFRRRKLIAAVVVVGVALSTALAWMEPPLYEATATLIVRPKRADITVSPDAGSGVVMERLGTEAINSQVQLLESRELLRGVLAKYISEEKARQGVERPPNLMEKLTYPLRLPQIIYNKMHDVPDPDPLERMVSVVQKGLDVYPASRSNLIFVSYTGGDPEWAARIVNDLVQAHIQRYSHLSGESDALRFYREQREILSQKLAKARQALQEFRQREGMSLTLIDETQLKARIAELELSKTNAEASLAEAAAREKFLRQERERLPAAVEGQPAVVGVEAAQMLQQRILELKMTRSELLSRYAPGSTKVKEIDRQIADLEALLLGQQTDGSGGNAVAAAALAPSYGQIDMQIVQTRADIAAAKAKIAALTNELSAYHDKLARIEQISSEKDRLENEVETTKAAYLNYMRKEEAARFSDALDKSSIVNVTIAEKASVPSLPMPSKRALFVWFGFIVSLLLGVGLAFLRDRLDPAIKSATEAGRIADAPVLAEIPS